MSQEIQEFVEKMKDWRENFPIEEYDYTKYNCEIADIMRMQNEGDTDGLTNFWNEKSKEDYFELKHPIHNEIKLRAIANYFNGGIVNYILFLDRYKKFIMLIIQVTNLINFIVIQNKIFIFKEGWKELKLGLIIRGGVFREQNVRNLILNSSTKDYNTKFAFTLAHVRPVHFTDFIANTITHLDKSTKIYNNNLTFFYPKDCQKIDDENYVYLFPSTTYNKKYQECFYAFMLHESLEEFTTLVEPKDLEFKDDFSLTLWLGLPGERRAWLEQIEGSALILKNLLPYFPRIKVYIDGMTSFDRQRQDFPENKILYNQVVRATKEALKDTLVLDVNELNGGRDFKNAQSLIVFKSLAGYDYRTKICYCSMCDIAISESETTALVPFRICKKPCAIICLKTDFTLILSLVKEYKYQKISNENLFCIANYKDFLRWDYHIPPEHIYNLSAEVLEELKNIKMHRLDVPPVELYAKKYEAEKNTQIKLNNNEATQSLLKNIENQKLLLEVDNLILDKELKTLQIKQLQVGYTKLVVRDDLPSAKARIHNHLSYKLGQIIIRNSKTLFDYIKLPYLLMAMSLIHKEQEKTYKEKIKTNPNLALPPLESYADYKEALKEKECFTYKLGNAFIKASKSWYKGGLIKFYFEAKRLEREFKNKKNDKES